MNSILSNIRALIVGMMVGAFLGAIFEYSFLFLLMFGGLIIIIIEVEIQRRNLEN